MNADWTETEVAAIVGDYMAMLTSEILGIGYNKTGHRKALAERLNGRSDGSIEFKHQNISAVLIGMGLPYIDGYKPRGNYQSLLATEVQTQIDGHPGLVEQLANADRMNPKEVPLITISDIADLFVPPPEQLIVPVNSPSPWLTKKGRKIDFAKRDAENRRLGKLGEKLVFDIEKKRLLEAGRDDLASRVEWISETCGDGIGYDVLSFHEKTESEKWVEVKTTGLGKFFPFYVSDSEVRCSEAEPERFHLYRVFNFSDSPQLYVLPGALPKVCQLEPILYRARF